MVALNMAAHHKMMQRGTLSFSEAVAIVMNDGKRARRARWEDSGRWVAYESCHNAVAATSFNSLANRAYVERIGGSVTIMACLTMQAGGKIMLGWTPTSGDLTADDWYILEDDEPT